MAKVQSAFVAFRKSHRQSEDFTGFSNANIVEGSFIMTWDDKESIIFPMDTIESITLTNEEE